MYINYSNSLDKIFNYILDFINNLCLYYENNKVVILPTFNVESK